MEALLAINAYSVVSVAVAGIINAAAIASTWGWVYVVASFDIKIGSDADTYVPKETQKSDNFCKSGT